MMRKNRWSFGVVINPAKNSLTCATIKDASIYHALSPWTALYRD